MSMIQMDAQNMLRMMFAQRFAESLRVRDRKAMVKGISQKRVKNNNSSSVTTIPSYNPPNVIPSATPS